MVKAIVLAAGSGKRMNSEVKKQFMELDHKPMLYYTLQAFEESQVDEIVLVVSSEDMGYVKYDILRKYGFAKVTALISGGEERYNSVYNGLRQMDTCDIVLIHDGARPFVHTEMINIMIEGVKEYGACITAVPAKDTVKICGKGNLIDHTAQRKHVYLAQTPQGFRYKSILTAYENMMDNDASKLGITDDAMVMETFGNDRVKILPGDADNIKITTNEDLMVGECILTNRNKKNKEILKKTLTE